MNIIKLILFLQIILLISCNSNRKPSPINLNYYEIKGIETAIPLPVDYRPVTVKEFEAYSKEETAPIQDFFIF